MEASVSLSKNTGVCLLMDCNMQKCLHVSLKFEFQNYIELTRNLEKCITENCWHKKWNEVKVKVCVGLHFPCFTIQDGVESKG